MLPAHQSPPPNYANLAQPDEPPAPDTHVILDAIAALASEVRRAAEAAQAAREEAAEKHKCEIEELKESSAQAYREVVAIIPCRKTQSCAAIAAAASVLLGAYFLYRVTRILNKTKSSVVRSHDFAGYQHPAPNHSPWPMHPPPSTSPYLQPATGYPYVPHPH